MRRCMSTFQVLDVPRTNPYFERYFVVFWWATKKLLKISSLLLQHFLINLNFTAQSCNRCCRRLVKLRIWKTYLLEYIFRKERYSILSETDFKTFCYKSKNKRSRALKLKLSKFYLSTKLKHLLLSWKIHTTLITFIAFKQCLRILVKFFSV